MFNIIVHPLVRDAMEFFPLGRVGRCLSDEKLNLIKIDPLWACRNIKASHQSELRTKNNLNVILPPCHFGTPICIITSGGVNRKGLRVHGLPSDSCDQAVHNLPPSSHDS